MRTRIPVPTKKSKELMAIKDEAHAIIDELVADGVKRAKIYRRLAHRLKVPEKKAHFAQINTVPQVMRAMRILEEWRDARNKKPAYKEKFLPHTQKNSAFAELKRVQARQATWWYRWLAKPVILLYRKLST